MSTDQCLDSGRVIIPYGRSVMALVAAHSLGQRGIEVIGCDSIDFTILSFSKYVKEHFIYPDPEKDETAFLEAMVKEVIKRKPPDDQPYVLMPIYKDTKRFAKHKHLFEPHIKVAAPDYQAISKLNPKDNFARTTEQLDIAVPRTWLPEDETALKEIIPEVSFPVVIKPYNQTAGRGIHKVNNEEELLAYWIENLSKFKQKSLVQSFADGKDYCFTALFDHGELKASMAYYNLHRFPAESGAGIVRETVPGEPFAEIAASLMKPLKWNGVAEFDFMWDGCEHSTPALIEVNTRFWGGLFQSVESGIDYPRLLYQLIVNGHIEPAGDAKIGTRTKMAYIWLFSVIKESINSDEDFAEIKKKGQLALAKLEDGEVLESIKEYSSFIAEYLGETLNMKKKVQRFKQKLEIGKTARNELLNSEDPQAAFGILFILGSLIRYGELPREVKF
ncbi:MAG: ATP-grasp domain-containing protein [Candidatus Competibacteraceae bacterium]|jgi:predicted ATP-grasp superfamily ATP-dependent carboligase|nr:ATP-grasp domain-containing protein [Candidatus Competibacteraceae bacterium]